MSRTGGLVGVLPHRLFIGESCLGGVGCVLRCSFLSDCLSDRLTDGFCVQGLLPMKHWMRYIG